MNHDDGGDDDEPNERMNERGNRTNGWVGFDFNIQLTTLVMRVAWRGVERKNRKRKKRRRKKDIEQNFYREGIQHRDASVKMLREDAP